MLMPMSRAHQVCTATCVPESLHRKKRESSKIPFHKLPTKRAAVECSIPVREFNKDVLSRGTMRTFNLGIQSGIRNFLRVRPWHKNEIATLLLASPSWAGERLLGRSHQSHESIQSLRLLPRQQIVKLPWRRVTFLDPLQRVVQGAPLLGV